MSRRNLLSLRLLGCVALFLAFPAFPLLALQFPYPLDRVVNKSELIVVARPTGFTQGGWTTIEMNRRPIRGREITVTATVIREIEGHCEKDITIRYVTDYHWLDGIAREETQVLFLRHGDGVYLPAHPELVSLPAVEGLGARKRPGVSNLKLVIEELGLVLSSPVETAVRKTAVVEEMFFEPPDKDFDRSLREAYDTQDADLRYHIMLSLLYRNDISTLDDAKELLLGGALQGRKEETVVNAIGSLRNRGAVPALKELLDSSRPMARKAAVKGLKHSGGMSEVPALLHALDDSDDDVAMYAMSALGHITKNRTENRIAVCSIDKFRRDRPGCVEPWRKLRQSYSRK